MQLIFVHTHPIQYFAPLYQYLTAQGWQLQVWYCSQGASSSQQLDKEFGTHLQWDLPLLEGYRHRFFTNEGHDRPGFGRYHHPQMLEALRQEPPSLLVVHGWNYRTYVQLLRQAPRWGHRLAFRAETNAAMEAARPRWQQWARRCLLRWLLGQVQAYCYIGQQSRLFYQRMGLAPHQLFFTPYAVDNDRFQRQMQTQTREQWRQQLGVPAHHRILLFSGKYIAKKRPLDAIRAFASLQGQPATLVMMGEGELRPAMQALIAELGLQQQVLLTGFVNQTAVPGWYAAADTLLMCSQYGETWGLSVNEGMNAGLSLILSDQVGCAADLLQPGINGWGYTCGDGAALTDCLQQWMQAPASELQQMGEASKQCITQYSFAQIAEGLKAALQSLR